MASSNGLFGELSGKIGNLVSYNLKGKNGSPSALKLNFQLFDCYPYSKQIFIAVI